MNSASTHPCSNSMMKWGALFALQAGISVAAGAFGAHGLQNTLDATALAWWHTASQYLMYHALGGLAVLAVARKAPFSRTAAVSFSLGNLLFAGSLYTMSLTGMTKLGMITPIGGVCYLFGWGAFALSCLRASRHKL